MTGEIGPVPREARPYQGLHAGLASRILAGIIDGVVITALIIAGYLTVAGIRFLWRPLRFHFPTITLSTFLALGAIVAIVYFTVTWSGSRRSYGDHVIGLRVVTQDSEQLRPLRSFLRAVAVVLFPIGLLWSIVSRENYSVQDLIFRTTVLYDWRAAHTSTHQSHEN